MERKTKQLLPLQVFPAQVKEVDENNRTCTVRVNDNVDLYEVKLYAVTDKDLKGFCLVPAQDSQVLVARIANGNELFVCSFSVVDKVVGTIGDKVEIAIDEKQLYYKNNGTEIKIESSEEQATVAITTDKVTIDANSEIVFNGGKNKGLVKIDKLTSQLNKIENDINNLKDVFKNWTPVAQDGGGALKTAINTWEASSLASSTNKDYEDTKVKH